MAEPARTVRGVVFDMDGTLAVGRPDGSGFALVPGVAEFVTRLRAEHVPYLVFTNGTAHPPERYAERLRGAGLALDPGAMLTPSSVAADFFSGSGVRRVLLLGVDGVASPLTDAGITIVRPGQPAADRVEAVYVGWHPDFGLGDIEAATAAILAGAPLYLSSDVPFFYSSKGRTLGISRLIGAAICAATGRRARVIGKPSARAVTVVARRLGCDVSEIAIVGDDPKLEAAMAQRCGALAVGVTSGLTDRAAWAGQPPASRAHHVVDRLDELLEIPGLVLAGRG